MNTKKIYILIVFLILSFEININAKESFFLEGVKLFEKKKYNDSKFKFEQDIVFNPKSELSYLYLAKIYNEEKNDELEEQNLNAVILLNPINEEALYLLTLLNIKKSDYSESDKLIKKFEKVCRKILKKAKFIQSWAHLVLVSQLY